MKNKINMWYNIYHLWTLNMVKDAVKKGVLTQAEYKEITGQIFE